jgi:hypothetical protein
VRIDSQRQHVRRIEAEIHALRALRAPNAESRDDQQDQGAGHLGDDHAAAQPLPAGFIATVNAPGGGSSRQTRRPDLVSGVNPYLGSDRNFLNPAAFAIPAAGTFGDLPRNALKGPNFQQFDLILNKRIHFSETKNLEFRTEVFNVFNHANFANPASTLNVALPTLTFNTTANAFVLGSGLQPGQAFTQSAAGSTFGLLRQTAERTVGLGTNRQIQFALRLNF